MTKVVFYYALAGMITASALFSQAGALLITRATV